MPPRHLFAADVAARRVFVQKANLDDTDQRLDQRLADADRRLTERLGELPSSSTIWATDRPNIGFGAGVDLTWNASGDGATTVFSIPGRISTAASRYVVIVGGVRQAPTAYSLPTDAATLSFVEAPPADLPIVIFAPFYGASSP